MPRPKNTEQRRREIVTGLLQTMARTAYEKASVASIARAAGLTPGLVHYHFKSKQSVLLALMEELHRRFQVRIDRRLDPEAEPLSRLQAFLEALLGLGSDPDREAVACCVAIGAEAVREAEVRKVYRDVLTRLLELLEPLVFDLLAGRNRSPGRAREIAVALLAAAEGCFQLAATVPDLVPPGFAARAVLQMAQGLVAAEEVA